jgi:hypothetical protein
LRSEGLPVGTSDISNFCTAVVVLGPRELYWAGRATLVSRAIDLPAYEAAFRRFWGGQSPALKPSVQILEVAPAGAESGIREAARDRYATGDARQPSALELLRETSFATMCEADLAVLSRLAQDTVRALPVRRSRRYAPARRGRVDVPRTLRRSLRLAGEPIDLQRRQQLCRPRRLVWLLDVSASMTPYTRGAIHFVHALCQRTAACEAFCFGTRLTRVTRQLARGDITSALAATTETVPDWAGGTRIGESLKLFLDEYGHLGMARGAIVLIYSDGLEGGRAEILAGQMARLKRLAHEIVWLNPLRERDGYQPLALGMAAALPQVDRFDSGHSMASLARTALELAA